MMDTRNFNVSSNFNIASLANALENWFKFQNYECQNLNLPNGDTVIEARHLSDQ